MVIGQKSGKDDVLLTLLERKTRDFSIIRLPDKSADSVLDAFQKIQSELGDYFSKVFRTITTDNSSEFARLSELETGTNNSVAYKLDLAFQEKGLTHFNYIICTHPDEDHNEDFLNLLKGNGQTRTYGKFDCSTEVDDNTTTKYREFASSVQTTFKRITVPLVGTEFKLGSACVEVLAVNSDGRGVTNDSSIVLMITYGDTKFLFTGDAESATESYLVNNLDIKYDVLKVAHHGSSTSTSEEFLYKAKPDYAVISVGYENRYGHPSDKVLTRLENRNIQIFRTDSGTVVCNSDGTTVDIHTRR